MDTWAEQSTLLPPDATCTSATDVAAAIASESSQGYTAAATAATAVGYGPLAQASAASATAIVRSPLTLIRSLAWADVAKDAVVPSATLCSLDLRLQEMAGIYWRVAGSFDMERELGVSGPPVVLLAQLVDHDGAVVLPQVVFRPCAADAYCAIWSGRGLDGFYVPPGTYRVRLQIAVDAFWDEAETGDLEILPGNPYAIGVVFTPKNDEDIRQAMRDAQESGNRIVGINGAGDKLMRDCWVEVCRGGPPGSMDAVLVARPFEGHMEATAPGYFSTPKRDYTGVYRTFLSGGGYWGEHSVVHLSDIQVSGVASTRLSLRQPATPDQVADLEPETPYLVPY